MERSIGSYVLHFENGGLEVRKDGKCLYFNRRPIYVSVKDYGDNDRVTCGRFEPKKK